MDIIKVAEKIAEAVIRVERKYYYEQSGSATKRKKDIREYIDRAARKLSEENGS